MSALEDEETQKKGVVFINYRPEFGLNRYIKPWLGRKGSKLQSVLPIRFRGIHFCLRNNNSGRLIAFIIKGTRGMTSWSRRTRVHKGAF
jgi:hypothetical protein